MSLHFDEPIFDSKEVNVGPAVINTKIYDYVQSISKYLFIIPHSTTL